MPKTGDRIECRWCGCGQSKVTNVWSNQIKWMGKTRTIIKRRRICRHCQLPYTTIETYESEEEPNLPDILPPKKPPPNGKGPKNPYV